MIYTTMLLARSAMSEYEAAAVAVERGAKRALEAASEVSECEAAVERGSKRVRVWGEEILPAGVTRTTGLDLYMRSAEEEVVPYVEALVNAGQFVEAARGVVQLVLSVRSYGGGYDAGTVQAVREVGEIMRELRDVGATTTMSAQTLHVWSDWFYYMSVVLSDPAYHAVLGQRRVSDCEFAGVFTGRALVAKIGAGVKRVAHALEWSAPAYFVSARVF